MRLAILLRNYQKRKQDDTLWALWELLQRIQQVYEEKEGWNQLASLHGKMVGSSRSRAEISPVAEGTTQTYVGD